MVSEVSIIREGLYGSTIIKNGEKIYLRMELITALNTSDWDTYTIMTNKICDANGRGIISTLMINIIKNEIPDYEDIKDVLGFSELEYSQLVTNISQLENKDKILTILKNISTGSNHMYTGYTGYTESNPGHTGHTEHKEKELNYITYATRNKDFSISNPSDCTLKQYIESYSDILISMGSDFNSQVKIFQSRGIFRNPYWVLEEKYNGLSMLLHGFTGLIAEKYFPFKTTLRIKPVGSMQQIIKDNLIRGEGIILYINGDMDILDLETSKFDPEGPNNYIKVSALVRIYNKLN